MSGEGKAGLSASYEFVIDYQELEIHIQALASRLGEMSDLPLMVSARWLAVKLLEGDREAFRILDTHHPHPDEARTLILGMIETFQADHGLSPGDHIMACRDRLAGEMVQKCVSEKASKKFKGTTLTKQVDRVVLNRALAPLVLVLSVYLIYELSIVQGYELTNYTWPLLAWVREQVSLMLPPAGVLEDPLLRSLLLWMVDSANTLLNYVPIFLILFALIAIMEDSGYMARIAFILDRIFHGFGLHGQSTLPFILGGVFAGGCAVPGVMATKGIPDERSRLATILTVPYMNCLAKAPLYILLVNIYFVDHKSWAMFFISTITIIMAMIIAKFLTAVLLKGMPTAPFVMELSTYHLPTLGVIIRRALDRTWQYIKKVGTIVVAVSVCVFILLQFPGISDKNMEQYQARMAQAFKDFRAKVGAPQNKAFIPLLEGGKPGKTLAALW